MNVTELITFTRDILDEPQAKVWTDAMLLRALNEAAKRIHLRLIEHDENYALEVDLLSNVVGTTVTTLNAGNLHQTGFIPPWLHSIKRIEDVSSPMTPLEEIHLALHDKDNAFSPRKGWFWSGDRRIVLKSDTAPDPSTFRIWYYRKFPPLVRFQIQSGKIAGSVVTVTVGVDDLAATGLGTFDKVAGTYKNAVLYIHAPLTGGSYNDPAGYKDVVTSWAASGSQPDYLITVATAPATLAVSATASFGPSFDEQHHELLCYMGALRALNKESNARAAEVVTATAKDLWDQFLASTLKRQVQSQRYGHYVPVE